MGHRLQIVERSTFFTQLPDWLLAYCSPATIVGRPGYCLQSPSCGGVSFTISRLHACLSLLTKAHTEAGIQLKTSSRVLLSCGYYINGSSHEGAKTPFALDSTRLSRPFSTSTHEPISLTHSLPSACQRCAITAHACMLGNAML